MHPEPPARILTRLAALVARMSCELAPRERRQLALALVVMLLLAGAQILPPIAVGEIVDALAARALDPALRWALLLGIAFVAMVGLGFLRHRLVEALATQTENDRRLALVDRLLRLDIAFYDGKRTGALNGEVSRSVQGLVKLLKLLYLDFVPATLLVLAALTTFWFQAPPEVAFLPTLAVGLTLGVVAVQIRSQDGVRTDLEASKNRLDGVLVELLGAIASVRALHTEQREMSRVETVSEHLRSRELEHHFAMSRFDVAKLGVQLLTTVGVIALGGMAVYDGAATPGEVVTYVLLLSSVFGPLRDVHRILDEGHEAGVQLGAYYALLDEAPDGSFAVPTSGGRPVQGAPALHLRDVDFAYRDGPPVLRGIDLEIHAGEFVGICGPSGSGKSTLVQLAPRIYHPTSGELRLFGHAAEHLSRQESADLVGYVAQTPFIIKSGTVGENIAYGRSPVGQHDIEAAARAAALHEDIAAKPLGYRTLAGTLSGGQRQRVALARAFLNTPPLLLLDEATSALDTRTERHVMEHIHELRRRRGIAVVAIAHRLDTLRDADRILVINEGQIAESGSYDALLARGGTFADLVYHGHRAAA